MKNTTFKKKALLSSIAMLLVAIVALGGATFAWFTSNPNATAKGFKMKTTSSTGLVIRTQSHNAYNEDNSITNDTTWGHTDYLRYTKSGTEAKTNQTAISLSPASFDPKTPGSAFKVEAENDDNYIAHPTQTVEEASSGVDYYEEKIYCKLTGNEAGQKSKIAFDGITLSPTTNSSMASAVRVMLVYHGFASASATTATDTLIGVYSPSSASNAVLTKKNDYYENATSATTYTFTPVANASTSEFGYVDDSGACYIQCYIYIDGEDGQVFSRNIPLSNLIDTLDINLTVDGTKIN